MALRVQQARRVTVLSLYKSLTHLQFYKMVRHYASKVLIFADGE